MLLDFLKKQIFLISLMFLLLSAQNQVSAKVDASKFGGGFNAIDATAALQGAINSRADTVWVPKMGSDWIVTPIRCVANQTIIFEKDVNIVAKRGEFKRGDDCLFRIQGVANVSLIGYGATFRMQKADYMNPSLYGFSEGRMCIGIFAGATGIKIMGLILRDSGGDGIFVYWPPSPSNVVIKDVICDNNYRQGISPCDFKNLTIENSVMINTCGAINGPWAGIDFEPDGNSIAGGVQNGKVINCYTANNYGGGIVVALATTLTNAADVQIINCYFSDGISDILAKDNGEKGTISYEDCILEGLTPMAFDGITPNNFGYRCIGKSAVNTYLTKFTNLLWQNCNPAIALWKYGSATVVGGLQFVNCVINEPDYQPTIMRWKSAPVVNISGNLTVYGPNGANSQLGSGSTISLQIKEVKTKPPILTSVKPDKGISAVTFSSATIPAKVLPYTVGNTIDISVVAYDPDNGTANGAGIAKVDFALWRSNNGVAAPVVSYSDLSAPYAWPITIAKSCPRGIYLLRITAYSNDGSKTVAVIPINIFNTVDGSGPYITATGIDLNYETINFMPQNDFLIRNTSQGFMVYSPFSTDSRIVISDLSGRQVTMAQNVKGNSWNNISTKDKFSNNVYFVHVTDSKGNNSIVKKAMITK
jgi:hypothetical protein